MSKASDLPPLHSGEVIRGLAGVYKLSKLVGQGSFGELWLARMDGATGGKKVRADVALKFEDEKSPSPSIRCEVQFYHILVPPNTTPLPPFLPVVYDFFPHAGRSCMAMQLLGKSLENRLDWCGRHMPLKDVLQIGTQVLTALQYMHDRKVIHRDIKPDNFLFGPTGSPTQDVLRIIDLGLAKSLVGDDGKHIAFNTQSMIMGTPRFMSINAHLGFQQSRRDDLMSLAYMLLYLLKGSLPWDGIREKDQRKKNAEIQKKKQSTPSAKYCEDGTPAVFPALLDYTKSLKFREDPDYERMRAMLAACAKQQGLKLDSTFSWSAVSDDSEISIKPQIGSNLKLRDRSRK